jgi:DNA-binding transcriptional LysR family regulator
LKIRQIATFIAVYQERSFTAAAIRVHATQSGVSMQIKELEDSVGLQLFERSARGVEPTPAGERFYAHAMRVTHELQSLRDQMSAIKGQVTGSVTAGLMPTFTRAALTPAVQSFSAEYPLVNVRIVEAYSAVLTEAVANEEIDFAIVPPSGSDPRLQAQYISQDRELFVTCHDTERKHLSPIKISAAGPLKLILPTHRNARRARLDAYLKGVGANVTAILEMDAMMGTIELIAASDWVSILPGALCYPDLVGGARKIHPIEEPPLFVDYVLITPASRLLGSAARGFADALKSEIVRLGAEIRERTSSH